MALECEWCFGGCFAGVTMYKVRTRRGLVFRAALCLPCALWCSTDGWRAVPAQPAAQPPAVSASTR